MVFFPSFLHVLCVSGIPDLHNQMEQKWVDLLADQIWSASPMEKTEINTIW